MMNKLALTVFVYKTFNCLKHNSLFLKKKISNVALAGTLSWLEHRPKRFRV